MTAQPKQAQTKTGAEVPDSKDPIERTVDNVNGQNIMGDFRPSDLLDTAGALAGWALTHPVGLAKASLGFWGELGKIAAGQSRHSVDPGDRRFSDPAWKENSIYSGLLQGYLALRQSMAKYATDSNLDERAHFLLDQVGDALAPSNFLLANPAALRRLKETRGLSLARGTRNLLNDVRKRRPIPSQVDETAFKVGENLAVTPGSVVLRTEMFELIQYAPQTEQVHQRPVLVVPSIVNKYYVFDLAPKRSILEYYVQKGMTVFVMVWRNPQPRHDRWGMSDYQDAVDAAVDATRAISQSEDVNIWAVCGAGPVVVSLAGYYAAKGTRKINSLLLVVSPLDMKAMAEAPSLGAFVDDPEAPTPSVVKKVLRNKRISATEFTLLFAMLRANELIWNYWVSNYLMGETPSAFDVLYWNSDGTGMTAQFNHDFSEFVENNPFVTPGADEGTRHADFRSRRSRLRQLRARGEERSSVYLAERVSQRPAARQPEPVRARQQRSHPDHRLPAGKSEGQLLHQRGSIGNAGRVAEGSDAPSRQLVGSRRCLDRRTCRAAGVGAESAGQRKISGAGRGTWNLCA